ncbi:MAG TPA: filamentous hemagglutinin family protein [Opitutaceae bacterium]
MATSFSAGSTIAFSGSGTITTPSGGGTGELTLVGDGRGGSVPVTMGDGSIVRLTPSDSAALALAYAADAKLGSATGTLQIRAPQTTAEYDSSQTLTKAPDVQVNPIAGTLKNASSIVVEGYRTYTTIGGYIDSVESDVDQNGQLFASAGNSATLATLLQGGGTDWSRTPLHIRPGAEIVGSADGSGPSTITFASSGTNSSVQVPANGQIGFPDLSSILTTNDLIKFSVAVTVNAADTGSYAYALTLNASSTTAASVPVNSQSSIALTRGASDSALQSSVDVTVTLTDGSQQTYAANSPLPFLPSGAVITFNGSGTLSALSGTVASNITQGFNAGSVSVPANAVVTMPLKGATVVFSKAGTVTYSGGTNVLPVELLGNTNYVAGSVASTLNPNGGTNISLTTTRAYVTVTNNGTFALPAGATSAGIQISPTDANATETDINFKSVSGGSISSSGGGTITTRRGGAMAQSNLSLDGSGIDLGTLGSSVTFSTDASIVASNGGTMLNVDGTTQNFAAGDVVAVPPGGKIVFTTSAASVHIATNDGNVATVGTAVNFSSGTTTFAPGVIVQLANAADQVLVRASGPVIVSNAGVLVVTALQDSKVTSQAASSTGAIIGLQNGQSYTLSGATVLNGNARGDLTLASTWDLSAFRYGSGNEPGALTLRTPGNLVFNANASLSDGFGPSPATSAGGLWQAPLLDAGSQSWSYNLIAGADLTAANARQVLPLAQLNANTGSILLGLGSAPLNTTANATRQTAVLQNYQAIRTGTGDIYLAAGRDLQILNDLATIYTAGTAVSSPDHLETTLSDPADFDIPNTYYATSTSNAPLNTPQYTFDGGNVSIVVQNNIEHLNGFNGTPASSKELPGNWLYRSGSVSSDGTFATLSIPSSVQGNPNTTFVASTSWWVDFTNFFEGVGALGGGNVTMTAGNNIQNVDAVIPTNARTTKFLNNGADLTAADQHLYQLGGGDLNVSAGHNIDGGVYYIERGTGVFNAGGSIVTNATRATLTPTQVNAFKGTQPDSTTWLPTTFYLGDGSLSVSARDQVLIGSVVNAFLLPQDVNNSPWLRTFYSTYGADDSVSVSSLTGDITLANVITPITKISSGGFGSLGAFIQNADLGASSSQPWLRLIESDLSPFSAASALLPPTLETTSFSGNINLVGDLALTPAAYGNVDLLAAKSINGFQPSGPQNAAAAVSISNPINWAPSQINLSDADPNAIPSVFSPAAVVGNANVQPTGPAKAALSSFNSLFNESGATLGTNVVLETKEALHGKAPETANGTNAIHNQDMQPIHLYATSGDISGLTLFSGKMADVIAGEDITDIGLYIQNATLSSVSVVSAGRDILAYDTNSPLRQLSAELGGTSNDNQISTGDIQISGPGTLEVLAGRNIALGALPINPTNDGTQTGITSIGNLRNANLPFQGSDLMIAAGLGGASPQVSTAGGILNFVDSAGATVPDGFIDQFLNPDSGATVAQRHLPELGQLLGFTIDDKNPTAQNAAIWSAFEKLSDSDQARYALSMFYVVLRDAGRDHNDSTKVGFGNYNEGYEAIASLFEPRLDFSDTSAKGFVDTFLDPSNKNGQSVTYLPKLGGLMSSKDTTADKIWADYEALSSAEQHRLAVALFDDVLADAAQQEGVKSTSDRGKALLTQAVTSLFGGQTWQGDINMTSRNIRTTNGGNISIFAPGGGVALGDTLPPVSTASTSKTGLPPPGIVTDAGGDISIFTNQNVDVGVARIFTLKGGNEIIWSSEGNIAAGKSSKTVQTAPPTQVLIDPQSGNVETDLSGLATGGGIGVLAAVPGVKPGNVDLIAPVGTVDAGDAGIRSTGNLNIAAAVVLNASNIQVGGLSSGTPAAPSAPNLAPLSAAASTSASASSAAQELTKQNAPTSDVATAVPSLIDVEVIGYGGDDTDDQS